MKVSEIVNLFLDEELLERREDFFFNGEWVVVVMVGVVVSVRVALSSRSRGSGGGDDVDKEDVQRE